MKRILALLCFMALYACRSETGELAACASNSDCDEGEVCFANGCGSPFTNIAVEVVANALPGQPSSVGLLAQDFLPDEINAVENFTLQRPAVVKGTVVQASGAGFYQGRASFLFSGRSLVIPGIERPSRGNGVARLLVDGQYELSMGEGVYAVTAFSDDAKVPPVTGSVSAQPGRVSNLDVVFPAARAVSGSLLDTEDNPLDSGMRVQAFEPGGGIPLSQPADVKGNGSFELFVKSDAGAMMDVVVSPALSDETEDVAEAMGLEQRFSVMGPSIQLRMDSYKKKSREVTGRVVDQVGEPISAASIYFSGSTESGAQFKSRPAKTNSQGHFVAKTLPSGTSGTLYLWVKPPKSSKSRGLRQKVVVLAQADGVALGPFTCPDKVTVRGTVSRPGGEALSGARIVATAQSSVAELPLPTDEVATTSESDGRFTLMLDPAVYRFDFVAAEEGFPLLSRYVSVEEGTQELDVGASEFSRGRTVTGRVTGAGPSLLAMDALPYVKLRFFRVSAAGMDNSSLLLAEGAADSTGNYKVILPTR